MVERIFYGAGESGGKGFGLFHLGGVILIVFLKGITPSEVRLSVCLRGFFPCPHASPHHSAQDLGPAPFFQTSPYSVVKVRFT
jgi:hypothetical protein